VSDASNSPESLEPGAGGRIEPFETTDVTSDTVSVRRSPRYPRFLALGAVVGVVAALILTVAFPDNAEFDKGQVFGFLLLACGTIGVALGALVALVIDRVLAGRAASVTMEHQSTHRVDE
jgi:hypothetical protein